jgi:hypothetical protein
MYTILDEDPDTSYLDMEGNESARAAYYAGELTYVGIRAAVEVQIPSSAGGYIIQQITSPGIWGAESDASPESDAYHRELYADECDQLAAMLAALNVQVTP